MKHRGHIVALALATVVQMANAQAVKQVAVTLTPTTIHVGDTAKTSTVIKLANGKPGNRTVIWSVSNSDVVSITSNGLVVGVAPGTATVYGSTLTSGSTSPGITGAAPITVLVTIPPPPPPKIVASVKVTVDPPIIAYQKTAIATAIARDSAGDVITGRPTVWSSSVPSVATVTQTGLVSTFAPGQSVISATVDARITAAVTITVLTPPPPPDTTPVPPSPGHPHEPPNFSSLSPTLTGNDVPFPESDGTTPPIGWVGHGFTSFTDPTFPGGAQKTLQTFFPPGFVGGSGPSAAWTYQRNVNAQNWPLGTPPRHSTAIYISWWHKFSDKFPVNHVANKMMYPESWKPSDGGNTNVQSGIITTAPSDSLSDDYKTVYPNYFTQYNALIYPEVGLQGPVIVDGVDYSVQGGVGLFGWTASRGDMYTVKRGQWHHWEVLIELNQPGQQDGSVQLWVDNALIIDFVHRIRWLLAETEEWSWLNYTTVYGGGGSVPNDGIGGYHWARDIYVSGTIVDHARVTFPTNARLAPRPKGAGIVPFPKGYVPDVQQRRSVVPPPARERQ